MDRLSSTLHKSLITHYSQEERFIFGLTRQIIDTTPQNIYIFYNKRLRHKVNKLFAFVNDTLNKLSVNVFLIPIDELNIPECKDTIDSTISKIDVLKQKCILDITTVPRQLLFPFFISLESHAKNFVYIYNEPGRYGNDFLYKEFIKTEPSAGFSGIQLYGKNKCLIITTGYDIENTRRIIAEYEPNRIYLAIQMGNRIENIDRNRKTHEELKKEYQHIEIIYIDSLGGDYGYSRLESIIKKEIATSNIYLCSLGPKPSIVTLYRLAKSYGEVCVNDVIINKENLPFSIGIGPSYRFIHNSTKASSLQYDWIPGNNVPDDILEKCSVLFSQHYGIWGAQGPKPGHHIAMPRTLLQKYLNGEANWLAIAKNEENVVGYAICRRFETTYGKISWITQLVVHTDYRQRGVATTILNSIWGFSNHFAWGLATASPFAVRALEKATRRRVIPSTVLQNIGKIKPLTDEIFYLTNRSTTINDSTSRIDSQFPVDHSNIKRDINAVSQIHKWLIGDLEEGEEWYAVTFQEQEQITLSSPDIRNIFLNADTTVSQAYQKMKISTEHKWTQSTEYEVDFIVKTFDLPSGAEILDFGCMFGRHAIELAKRGFHVTAIDFVKSYIDHLDATIPDSLRQFISIHHADCRTIQLDKKYNYALCLYDVIGSFPNDVDNGYIANTISTHLYSEGKLLLSVMNLELSADIAKHKDNIIKNPDALLDLAPSNTMEQTGNVFNPEYYIYDDTENIFYRKEQFEHGDGLPCELIVRDKRYSKKSIAHLLESNDFTIEWARYVALKKWDTDLPSRDIKAKELLVYCKRN